MTALVGIFARGGSKGVPGKNLLLLEGKTLLARTVLQARSLPIKVAVQVSSDSAEIRGEGQRYGAEIPFARPLELSTDSSPEWKSWQHMLENYQRQNSALPDSFIVLPVTSPLRSLQDILNCIEVFNSGRFDIVVSANEAQKNPYFNMLEFDEFGNAVLCKKVSPKPTRRQDAPRVFEMNNAVYVARPNYILSSNDIFDGNVGISEMSRSHSLDIDTKEDLEVLNVRFGSLNE